MSATKIGGFSESHLFSVAEEAVKKKTSNTVILDEEAEERIPKFDDGGMFAMPQGAGSLPIRRPRCILLYLIPYVVFSQNLSPMLLVPNRTYNWQSFGTRGLLRGE